MPSLLIDSAPYQTTYALSSGSAGNVPEDDGALSGPTIDEPDNAVSNTDHSVVVGAQFVIDQAAGSPHRPGVVGVAISDECGLIPEVDGATPESIARIAHKYSLAEVVDGLLNKAPFELQDVRPIPLSGCPVKGSEASVDEAMQFCDSGCSLVHALPKVNPCAGDPLAHAIPSSFDVNGILQCPDIHRPYCSKTTCVPVGTSSGNVAAVQGLSPCNPCFVDPAGRANRIDPSVDAIDVGDAVKPYYATVHFALEFCNFWLLDPLILLIEDDRIVLLNRPLVGLKIPWDEFWTMVETRFFCCLLLFRFYTACCCSSSSIVWH
ncbi:hypothetical protein Nepgr_014740 [Nepenthes gracilis]|uniref:Uncharacterized protein n=1 Tax=Nepenthes gracilis TaxID=150966 RepID=A0AAD3XQF1_NEPGR|nr:hypothetical protein Nepgr_014740 [Nepenthes gracilis]